MKEKYKMLYYLFFNGWVSRSEKANYLPSGSGSFSHTILYHHHGDTLFYDYTRKRT